MAQNQQKLKGTNRQVAQRDVAFHRYSNKCACQYVKTVDDSRLRTKKIRNFTQKFLMAGSYRLLVKALVK